MEVGEVRNTHLEIDGHHPEVGVLSRDRARSRPDVDVDWQALPVRMITLGLLAYGCYLAWESWGKLLQLMESPLLTDVGIIAVPIHVIAPLFPALSYILLIHLSWRRDAPRFASAVALCLLGLLTAAIEVFVHAIG